MLELKAVMLCDAATVREGLLQVLGAGLTVFYRESYPAPFNADIAMQFEMTAAGATEEHQVQVIARNDADDADPIFQADFNFIAQAADEYWVQSLPLVLTLRNAGIPAAGRHEIGVWLDGELLSALHFEARVGGPSADLDPPTPFG